MTQEQEKDLLKDSEEMIATIINYLFQNGVKKTNISLHSIGRANALDSELELKSNPHQGLFRDAMDWLIAEGVVRINSSSRTGYHGCTLTSYGFALLGQKLVGSAEGETVGKAVRNVSEDSASYSKVGDLLGGILGGFTKSIGS